MTADARITADGEIQSGEIKLTTHKHGGVQVGGAKTLVPE
jgi:phage baseplate assembly protein gpV